MKIEFVDIQNFRKLENCRIDFSEKETVFVGANNSGKTTAMDALIKFLKKCKFTTRDFTLTNWLELNKIGDLWIKETDFNKQDLTIDKWENNLPTIDLWLTVEKNEIHYVMDIIPILDWDGGSLGVRLRFEPNKVEELFKEFIATYNNSKSVVGEKDKDFKLWPKHLWDFLDEKNNLNKLFSIKTYLLNPLLKTSTQKLPKESIPLESDVISGLIKVDIINAQRGFSDVNSEGNSDGNDNSTHLKNLSSQLRNYYNKHLNPSENPTKDDITALKAIQEAKKLFDDNLMGSFKPSLKELEKLNYPGFGNPTINLSSQFKTVDSLDHESAVQYCLLEYDNKLSLPEKYNGLGYQNLISIIFKLISFRDDWMQVGKRYKTESKESNEKEFEPLHLVLIEEPEAHLHAQVQQVFINEAYSVLINNSDIQAFKNFTTQLVISTHSNHIAHEIKFTSLRYFKRNQVEKGKVNTSTVVNLSDTFGKEDSTTKFAIRYLKTTHCDLFFADAVILVEGPAERMLLPYFIKHHTNLASCYISILEIGGSHAHTLKPLIEKLGIIALVITDLDSINPNNNNKKIQPEKLKGFKTGNDTLKGWIPIEEELDKLLELPESKKELKSFPIKVAYQLPLIIKQGSKDIEVFPYTFEDSLVMENRTIFEKLTKENSLLGKMIDASVIPDIKESAKEMYESITAQGAKKAEFALELLYIQEPDILVTPKYIKEGLNWLEKKLIAEKDGLVKVKEN